MKDPYSLVASIRIPGTKFRLVDIWHCDRGHTDGACGWSYPRLTEKQRRAMRDLGFWEAREKHYLRYPFKIYTADLAEREALYRALILTISRVLRIRISYEEAATIASERCGLGGYDGLDRIFCWVPGYHSNSPKDRDDDRSQHWAQTCAGIARGLLARRRPWWRHPRWHIHHWRFYVPALVRLSPRLDPLRH